MIIAMIIRTQFQILGFALAPYLSVPQILRIMPRMLCLSAYTIQLCLFWWRTPSVFLFLAVRQEIGIQLDSIGSACDDFHMSRCLSKKANACITSGGSCCSMALQTAVRKLWKAILSLSRAWKEKWNLPPSCRDYESLPPCIRT